MGQVVEAHRHGHFGDAGRVRPSQALGGQLQALLLDEGRGGGPFGGEQHLHIARGNPEVGRDGGDAKLRVADVLVDEAPGPGHPLPPAPGRRGAFAQGAVGQGHQVEDDLRHGLSPALVLRVFDLAPDAAKEVGQHGAGPFAAGDRAADQGLDVTKALDQDRRRHLDAQHVVGLREAHLVGARGVAQGEVAGLEHRLPS